MRLRQLIKISDVARDTELNRGTLTRLYHETAERVELSVLDTLCNYLKCDLLDLFEYIPNDGLHSKPLD
ncbi:MAG: helix-turn-helix transcriptional regulator [Azonexus sp.]